MRLREVNIMSKNIIALGLVLAATPLVAQAAAPDVPPDARVVYGTNMGELDGKFVMNVGTGKPNECGTNIWYHPPQLILKKEEAGSCMVQGKGVVPQYKITLIEDTPEERSEVKQ